MNQSQNHSVLSQPAFRLPHLLSFCFAAALYIAHSLHYKFLQDDAFIYFRYSKNLANGHGLVFNIGERVEGFVDLIWPLLLSLLFLITSNVETFIHFITIGFGLCSLILTFYLASNLSRTYIAGFLSILFLATDRTFAVWSTSGMDTQMFSFFALVLSFIVYQFHSHNSTPRKTVILGLTMIIISLTRPSGVIFSVLALSYLFFNRDIGVKVKHLLASGSIWGFGLLSHLAWRYTYYGELLPNTYYTKVTGIKNFTSSLLYFQDFICSFPFQTAIILCCMLLAIKNINSKNFISYISFLIILYCIYLFTVGGGFMEFRLINVILPYSYILVSFYICRLFLTSKKQLLRTFSILLTVALILTNIYCGLRFDQIHHKVLTQHHLSAQTTNHWIVIGKWFGKIALPDESIAVTAAGAIPYYSGLRCLDIHGLVDKYVARRPADYNRYVGHQKIAPPEYIKKKKITFVLGHPLTIAKPNVSRLTKDEFFVEVENSNKKICKGNNFFIKLKTTLNKNSLITSLKNRKINVIY